MKSLLLNEIRNEFINYFEKNNHTVVKSSNLVPENDPTLLFTNSGMVQFKNTFTGLEKREYSRAVTSQKCIRAGGKHNDLENVGHTARHHTFFEMLGNFSFGDYFKEEAIDLAWKLLTKVYELPREKLLITIYHEDEEAEKLWKKISGINENKIIKIASNDNFWSMGDLGPCGPCSEIFYDHGDHIEGGIPGSKNEDGDRFIEIWNLVFMQFEQVDKNKRIELPKPSIDTGMGLERISAVLQGTHDNYEIDLFKNLIRASSEVTGTKVNDRTLKSHRVIADHIRSASFLISEGVIPSNEGRGYVLRRILRRAIRHSNILGCKEIFLHNLVRYLIDEMGEAYPILIEEENTIKNIIKDEEIKFKETLERGLSLLNNEIKSKNSTLTFSGKKAFELYDTYGFPLDLTQDVLKGQGWKVDVKEFDREMQNQRSKARKAWSGSGDKNLNTNKMSLLNDLSTTKFIGYENYKTNTNIKLILKNESLVNKLEKEEIGELVFEESVFYAESGGQLADRGKIISKKFEAQLIDCQKVKTISNEIIFLHTVKVLKGVVEKSSECELVIDRENRLEVSSHHSATHLMHEALRQMFGTHVKQKGSLVTRDRLRFDFSYNKPINSDQIHLIENIVNNKIIEKSKIVTQIMKPEEAINKGAIALFGEKYGEEVRVVSMGGSSNGVKMAWSVELCGGTHLFDSGEALLFKIINETGVSSGVRRIEAVTRKSAMNYYEGRDNILTTITKKINSQPNMLLNKIDQLLQENSELKLSLKKIKKEIINQDSDDKIINLNGINFSFKIFEDLNPKDLKPTAEKLLNTKNLNIVCVISKFNEKVSSVVSVDKKLLNRFNAIDLVNIVSREVKGREGGGRPDMAQSGGQDINKIDNAIDQLKKYIVDKK